MLSCSPRIHDRRHQLHEHRASALLSKAWYQPQEGLQAEATSRPPHRHSSLARQTRLRHAQVLTVLCATTNQGAHAKTAYDQVTPAWTSSPGSAACTPSCRSSGGRASAGASSRGQHARVCRVSSQVWATGLTQLSPDKPASSRMRVCCCVPGGRAAAGASTQGQSTSMGDPAPSGPPRLPGVDLSACSPVHVRMCSSAGSHFSP